MTSQLKTIVLLGALSGLVIVLGGALGGQTGVILACGFALIMNIGSYWFSDRIVLKMYGARELDPSEAPYIHQAVEELAMQANIPKPRICIVPEKAPNAFATGRDPAHGVVAVTEGIVSLLSPQELRGVLAHEIGHIANRDILIQSVAAVLGSAIVGVANMMQFAAIFGGRSNNAERSNPLLMIAMAVLAPLAATIIQMAISRSREYLADDTGAAISGQPLALASALQKLALANERIPMERGNPSTENMFIVSPLFGGGVTKLFSTHPDIHERIARLQAMAGGRS